MNKERDTYMNTKNFRLKEILNLLRNEKSEVKEVLEDIRKMEKMNPSKKYNLAIVEVDGDFTGEINMILSKEKLTEIRFRKGVRIKNFSGWFANWIYLDEDIRETEAPDLLYLSEQTINPIVDTDSRRGKVQKLVDQIMKNNDRYKKHLRTELYS